MFRSGRHCDRAIFPRRRCSTLALGAWGAALAAFSPTAALAVSIVFLAHPRGPDDGLFKTQAVNERGDQYLWREGTQLVIRDLETGAEQVLVESRALDFSVSLDGQSLYYSRVHRGASRYGRGRGSDIYRLRLDTGEIVQLTDGPGWNCQPVELPDGVAFLTNRDGWKSPHDFTPALVIYRMDRSGRQVARVWHAGLGGAFGISLGPDGRLYFASGEQQGFHAEGWAIWSINQNGSDFQPEISSVGGPWVELTSDPWDWPAIAANGSLLAAHYYDTRVYGLIHVAPRFEGPTPQAPTKFGSPLFAKNPPMAHGFAERGSGPVTAQLAWQRRGKFNLTPLATSGDWESLNLEGRPLGIFSHPWPIAGNGAYVTWTGDQGDLHSNLGVYEIADVAEPIADNSQLKKVVDQPDRHEWMAKPIVPFAAIYGLAAPPTPTGTVAEELTPGSPYSVVGTSDVQTYFEWVRTGPNFGETSQIAMKPDEAEWVRILHFNPTTMKELPGAREVLQNDYGGFTNKEGFYSQVNERIGFYDELIPVRKFRTPTGELHLGPDPPPGSTPVLRPDGRPDTSWQAQIPANQPYSFQLLNARGEAIEGSTAQTWHQNIPGERRTDCQGCHAHHQPDPLPFAETIAASPEYRPLIKRLSTTRFVVWDRDLKPRNIGVPQRPYVKQIKQDPYLVRTDVKAFRSFERKLDDPRWSDADRRLVAAWQDTGFLSAAPMTSGAPLPTDSHHGPYADTMNPTVALAVLPDRVVVGACDPQAGIEPGSLRLLVDGDDVTDQLRHDPAEETWTLRRAVTAGVLEVRVRDRHRNETAMERIVGSAGPEL